jgi:hypothetical protein
MIGGKEVVELGPDLRLRSPVRHKQRYSYKNNPDRRPVTYYVLADPCRLVTTDCRHQ